MNAEIVARVRRSSLVSTFGVGSLLPAEEDSVMICGIDDWSEGDIIVEPRLAASLGVQTFRAPSTQGSGRGDIPAVRFPEWAFCPSCRRLGPFWTVADAGRRCRDCAETVSPSRFVSCCTSGHIEDFPYRAWVHENGATPHDGHDLKLVARGHTSALGDLIVECSCGRSRSMEGSFDIAALRGVVRCSGSRPWLAEAPFEPCDKGLRTLQRGSSNVWFGVTRSAISIPSAANRSAVFVEERFRSANPDTPAGDLAKVYPAPPGCTEDDIRRAIEHMRNPSATAERPSERQLRAEEYRALVNGLVDDDARNQFLCETLDLTDSELPDLIAQVSRVGRLREVRALTGFTRIVPSTGEGGADVAPLSLGGRPWLPAMEVLGEGLFVRIDDEHLVQWARGAFAQERVRHLLRSQDQVKSATAFAEVAISAHSLLLHSIAHVLINELSLSAGYPAASIRERVYDDEGQTGILIFTATADSAGSLGGLAAQSEPRRFAAILRSAITRALWCTTDPVCIESRSSGVDGMNLAACHACLLVPETSCERFNLQLDRATLIGIPPEAPHGYFSGWIDIV